MTISFGDTVKVLSTEQTNEAGLSGKSGEVLGETSPSSTGVTFFGDAKDDYVINVEFQDINEEYWFTPELLELVEQDNAREDLKENLQAINDKKKWWQVWK
jgi:hypothetical protein